MTWSNFQQSIYESTEEEIKRFQKAVLDDYRQAIKDIENQIKEAYAKVLSNIDTDQYYNEMLKYNRLNNLLANIKAQYTRYSKSAQTAIKNSMNVAFSSVYYKKLYAANWITDNFQMGYVPDGLIEFSNFNIEEAWKKIFQKTFGDQSIYRPQSGSLLQIMNNNLTTDLNKIRQTITQGLIQGKSYTNMMDAIKNIIGKELRDKDGNIKMTGAKANAMRIIQTESNRVMNTASYASSKYLESLDIEVERMLLAVLDNRTRPQSAQMDGQRKPIDKPFVYPSYKGSKVSSFIPGNTGVSAYDIRDRETVIDIIDGYTPQGRRGKITVKDEKTGKDKEIYQTFSFKYFDQWAKENGLTRNKYGQLLQK